MTPLKNSTAVPDPFPADPDPNPVQGRPTQLVTVIIPFILVATVLLVPAVAAAAEAAGALPTIGDQLMQKVVPLLLEVVGAVLVVLLAVWRLRAPQWIAAATDNQLLQAALAFSSDLIRALVTRAQATAVDRIKAALADGTISRAEYEAALAELKASMVEEVLTQTVGRFGAAGVSTPSARKIIDAKIEAEIPVAKATVAASKPPLILGSLAQVGETAAGPQSPAS